MWKQDDEIEFFRSVLDSKFGTIKDLFYNINGKNFAYIPKSVKENVATLQSRNSLIGNYTETWCANFFDSIAKKFNLFALKGVECNELGLIKQSRADLAFCTTNETTQKAKNIKIIFEIKMSIVNNYEFINNEINFIGDYTTHKGMPSLLRSDSVLKAIGKAINIRVSSESARSIPIIILGNAHISKNYLEKIDHLGQYGVLQKVISLNPSLNSVKSSKLGYFDTPNSKKEIIDLLDKILNEELYYFSAMLDKKKLAEIIKESAKADQTQIAKIFLEKIKGIQ